MGNKVRIGVGWGCIAVLFCLSMLTGCDNGTRADIKQSEAALRAVLERHDAYVKADTKLDSTEKGIALRSSELITRMIDTALKKPQKTSANAPTNPADAAILATYVGNHSDTLKQVGVTRSYMLQDGKECANGECKSPPGVVSTHELASKGLFFESERHLNDYLRGQKQPKVSGKDIKNYSAPPEMADKNDEIRGQEALERLFQKHSGRFAGAL